VTRKLSVSLCVFVPLHRQPTWFSRVRILNSRRRFCQTFQVSIRRYSGRCCFVLEKIFRFLHLSVASVLPQTYAIMALILGKLFDDKIETVLGILFP
jgi:hypothetical protein